MREMGENVISVTVKELKFDLEQKQEICYKLISGNVSKTTEKENEQMDSRFRK